MFPFNHPFIHPPSQVMFVDYGNVELLSEERCAQLPKGLAKVTTHDRSIESFVRSFVHSFINIQYFVRRNGQYRRYMDSRVI